MPVGEKVRLRIGLPLKKPKEPDGGLMKPEEPEEPEGRAPEQVINNATANTRTNTLMLFFHDNHHYHCHFHSHYD